MPRKRTNKQQSTETQQSQKPTQDNIPPGFTLRHTLRGHSDWIGRIAWSPDGKMLASSSEDKTIRLWDGQTGQQLRTLEGHTKPVLGVAWSPDGKVLASGSVDKTIRLWDGQTGQPLRNLEGHNSYVVSVAWSPNGKVLASGSYDNTVRLWDGQTGQPLRTLGGHSNQVLCVAWSPEGRVLASGSNDYTIRLWNGQTGEPLRTLEGHTAFIKCLSFSWDGRLLASKSEDNTSRIWRTDKWEEVAKLEEPTSDSWPPGVAFYPSAPVLATLGEKDTVIRIWDLDFATLLGTAPSTPSVHYTSAKIALVGDSAVGKTGLGYRIAKDRFLVTESTHGQQFWVVDKLGMTRDDGTQCEAVLWDFAGQPNFRPIHALFLDEVDLALVLFDPSRPDTFTGVDYWLKQLGHKGHTCHTVLVAARTDVGQLSLSPAELEAFCRERNISGGFIATSAKTNVGVDELLELIRRQIDWNAKPATVTTETFKRIKDFVLKLKADAKRKNLLVSQEQLCALLEATDPEWGFSDAEMLTAVGHLQNHGYVTILRRSSEEQSILLVPEVLINLAASYMSRAQSNEKGLGSLEEARALRNDYRFPEVENLDDNERDTLLNAVTELFLDRNICFRESVDNQTFLIFPSLILERPPQLLEEKELVEDMTYIVIGPVENVYPALVVLLGYSPTFQRTNQWRKQAQYETARGDICGFKQVNDNPAELELVLYYRENTPDFVRSRFQGLFEEILHARNVTFRRYPPIFCPQCGRQQERRTVMNRIDEGKSFLFCVEDAEKISLPQTTGRIALSPESRAGVTRDQALSKMRTSYETALVSVKGVVRDRKVTALPTCFVSYAWGNTVHERWVSRLADDLRNASVDVVLDQLHNPAIGANIARFISRIAKSDFILVVGTPIYLQKCENNLSPEGSVLAAEVDLMGVRLLGTEQQKASILPVLLEGTQHTSLPPLLQGKVRGDFTREEWYFVTLFDLVLTILHIPFDDPIVRDLRVKLREEAQALV